jgi:MYXO-CTERM domain-containing protein
MCVGDPVTGVWCNLRQQLGITSTAVNCVASPDGPIDAGPGAKAAPKGCCETGSGGATSAGLLGTLVAGMLLLRRRRAKLA